jgi:hypothetical protein
MLYWSFAALAKNLDNPPANGKQGPIPKEICQTLLTNEHASNITKLTQTSINSEKYVHFLRYIKSLEHLQI